MSEQDEADEPQVNFDLERMKRAVAGPFVTVPDGLTREEFREWIHQQANPQETQP